ncbi:multifunctional methyltransferase subunit TRM112-like protein [Neocloeon triangulifer]|uniref:multifunctional methyltransferase subunit TRM112-like protein n=1 Tax=Neocloeon triangulifer TaxID=2078957 RepID=UPI00286F118A|nr:multifunctional methyltransferase subunit TRM112-like protein [Neocloeon triangulifer]
MKLLTHNMLSSRCIKGVSVGYPLKILAKNVKLINCDFDSEFTVRIIQKLDWNALWEAAESIGHIGDVPRNLSDVEEYEKNDEFLKKVHHIVLEVEVIEGELECPETGRKFPIEDGVPNMLLNEDEV